MKAVGNDQENTLTIFVFIFLSGNEYGNRRARLRKRNRIHGRSKSKQFDQKHVGNGREAIFKTGHINACNHFKRRTQHNKFNHTYIIHREIKLQSIDR